MFDEKLFEKLSNEKFWDDVKERYFEERTRKHISLVQEAIMKIVDSYPEIEELIDEGIERELIYRGKIHDASKLKEPERTPYISITWRHKLENEEGKFNPIKGKGYQTPGLLAKEDENEATLHHILNNHPEYWLKNKEEANIDPKDRDKSVKIVDASKMPPLFIAEMVADWQAMSWELEKNTTREWFDKQKDVRWHFSPEQEKLIDKLLKVFENGSSREL